jgi:hypothetical protein
MRIEQHADEGVSTIMAASVLAALLASYVWLGAGFVRLLADLPSLLQLGAPLRF